MTYWYWPPVGAWYGNKWEGPEQIEDRSVENIRRCYAYLLSLPYQTAEDRQRLLDMRDIEIVEVLMG